MKQTFNTLILCLLATTLFSQSMTLKGIVKNSQNNEPIPYAAVGLMKANKGISTDENGRFELEDVEINDTLIVSCVGFEKFIGLVKDVKTEIKLAPSVFELPTVTVKPLKRKELILNDFPEKRMGGHFRVTSFKSANQLAQVFEHPDSGLWFLKSIRLAQSHIFLIFPKEPSVFKIRFYGVDETGKPNSGDLYPSETVKSDGKAFETINLSGKEMIMPKTGLAIAIEWIKIESNEYSFKSTGKDKSGKKQKSTHIYYAPKIGMLKSVDEKRTVFQLTYKNNWIYDEPLFEKGFKYEKLKIALTLSN